MSPIGEGAEGALLSMKPLCELGDTPCR